MTSRIRISPEDLMTLIQAAAELADLYDLDLVPWADKAPKGLFEDNGEPLWTAKAAKWREPIEGEDPRYRVKIEDIEPGQPRALGSRIHSIRSLHKTYMDRLDAMRKKYKNAQLNDSTYEWIYGKKRRPRKK